MTKAMGGACFSRFRRAFAASMLLLAVAAPFAPATAEDPAIEALKSRVASANLADRPSLCIHISEKELDAADKFYVAGETEQAQAALTDVVAFSSLARDYSIQARKHEKQAEIAIRRMAHKLASMKHAVSHEDQEQVQKTIDRLEHIRDELLQAMFEKGDKK